MLYIIYTFFLFRSSVVDKYHKQWVRISVVSSWPVFRLVYYSSWCRSPLISARTVGVCVANRAALSSSSRLPWSLVQCRSGWREWGGHGGGGGRGARGEGLHSSRANTSSLAGAFPQVALRCQVLQAVKPVLNLRTNEKLSGISWQLLRETCSVINYSTGWRKDVVKPVLAVHWPTSHWPTTLPQHAPAAGAFLQGALHCLVRQAHRDTRVKGLAASFSIARGHHVLVWSAVAHNTVSLSRTAGWSWLRISVWYR